MKRILKIAALGIMVALSWASQTRAATIANFTGVSANGTTIPFPYQYLLPPSYNPAANPKYPLIVFLHGIGELGNDNAKQMQAGNNTMNGALNLVKNDTTRATYPFIMVAPQCPSGTDWASQTTNLVTLINTLKSTYNVDPDRIIITGISLGGLGTWAMIQNNPTMFAAAFTVSSAGDPNQAYKLVNLPIWSAIGAADGFFPTNGDNAGTENQMAEAIRAAGGRSILTFYPVLGHSIEAWAAAYRQPLLLPWMMAQRRGVAPVGIPGVNITSSGVSGLTANLAGTVTDGGLGTTAVAWYSNTYTSFSGNGTENGTSTFYGGPFNASLAGGLIKIGPSQEYGKINSVIDAGSLAIDHNLNINNPISYKIYLAATGVANWTAAVPIVSGSNRITVMARSPNSGDPGDPTDPNTLARPAFPGYVFFNNVVTVVSGAGSPPSITGTPPSPATVGTAYSFTFGKTGSPTPTFMVTTGSLPPGLSLNGTTGVISGTPTGTGGVYAATVTASNGITPAASTSFSIAANASPAFTNATAPSSGVVGTAYNGGSAFTFTTSGNPKPSLTYSGTLPTGMTFTPGSGGSLGTATLAGTPTTAGSYSIVVTAANGIGTNATQTVNFTISSGVTAPTITGTPPTTGTTGTAYSYTFSVAGTAPFTYASSGLPPGLNFTNAILSGTPTTAGSYNVTVTATNSAGSNSKSFTLVVSNPGTLPSGWTLAGINLATGSTASYASGTGQYSITGASVGDTWGYNDSFQYVYQTLTGDGSIVCQYVSLTNTSSTAKAGIMLRSTLASNSSYAMMCYYPNTTTNFQYRTTSGGLTDVAAAGYGSAVWYKMTRSGNNFSGYVSTNSGSTWTQVGTTQTIAMGSTIYVGLVNCSVSSTASTAVLGNVTIYSSLTRAAIGSTTGDTSTISGANYTLGAVSNGDIWAANDSFAYLYEPLVGDGTLIGDYASLTNTDPNAKGGFMIRNGTATNAPFAMICFCPSGGSYFMWRTTAGANVDFFAGAYGTSGLKYKLVRTGNVFSAWVSTNGGSSWNQIGSNQTIVMTGSVQAGLVHCSHSATAGSTTFNNVVLP